MKYRYNHGAVLKVTREDTAQTIEQNFKLMKENGLNTVVIWPAAFWWEEKREGYPFNTGREILEIAAKCGIDVIMELAGQLTSMEYAPDFLMKPEYLPLDRNGNRLDGQSAFGYLNYFHPEVRARICEHYRSCALAYKDYPALIAYDVFNETMFCSYDEYSLGDFRAWLCEKYGSIDELNRVWERTYSDFRQIDCQTWKWMSVMPEADFCMWRRESVARFLKPWCDAILEVDKEHMLIADNIHSQVTPNAMYARPHGDYSLKGAVDTIGMSFYPKQVLGTAEPTQRWEIFDGFASAAKREGFYISEMQTHIQALFNPTTCVLPSELKTWCLEGYAAGAKALVYWMWRPFTKGLQTLGRGLVNYRGISTERLTLARELGEIFEKYGVLRPVRSKIGVLYHELSDDLSRRYACNYRIDENIYNRSVFGAYKALYDINVRADIVTMDEIEKYSAVVLTNTCAISKKDCQRLAAYVKAGGILIADGKLAVVDELSMAYEVIPGGGLDKLAGQIYYETDDRDYSFTLDGQQLCGYWGRDIPECVSAEIIARFGDGVPAVLKNDDCGTMYTVNTQLFYGYEKGATEAARELVRMLASRHSLRQIEADGEIKYRICEADGKYLVFAFNYTEREINETAVLTLDGGRTEIAVSVDANDVRIYEVDKK